MNKTFALFLFLWLIPVPLYCGCIGPTDGFGKCTGAVVPWDTHRPDERHREPPPGFIWDHRRSEEGQRHKRHLNPFTGEDPHDSRWLRFDDE